MWCNIYVNEILALLVNINIPLVVHVLEETIDYNAVVRSELSQIESCFCISVAVLSLPWSDVWVHSVSPMIIILCFKRSGISVDNNREFFLSNCFVCIIVIDEKQFHFWHVHVHAWSTHVS